MDTPSNALELRSTARVSDAAPAPSIGVAGAARRQPPVVLAVATLCALFACVAWASNVSVRLMLLVIIAAGLGVVLQRSRFGFSAAFRAVIERREADGLRLHALMISITSLAFLPLLVRGEVLGHALPGFGTGLGVSLVCGALMFGVGMQLAGGCASGTLFALGNGNLKHLGTGAGFVLGSTLAAAQIGFWRDQPEIPPIFVQVSLGLPLGLLVQVGGLLLAAAVLTLFCRRPLWSASRSRIRWQERVLHQPWPMLAGAMGLASLNIMTLVVSGQPWGETSAFALWGSKLVTLTPWVDAAHWDYWRGQEAALGQSIFTDVASIMDLAIVVGAFGASVASGEFNLRPGRHPMIWLSAGLGGTLMGYGARIAGGCNIGAYFSAGSSGSVSAWLWLMIALVGSAGGLYLRARLRLDQIEARTAATC